MNLQLDVHGRLRHLLTTEGLPRSLLERLLDRAEPYARAAENGVKKDPLLTGRTVVKIGADA